MCGETIRKARKAAKLSQKKLGLLCGYSEQSAERIVQFWEKDLRDPPIEKLRLLANALGITLDELIP
jgi:transcriptional regulator with XRE-family HTH domain